MQKSKAPALASRSTMFKPSLAASSPRQRPADQAGAAGSLEGHGSGAELRAQPLAAAAHNASTGHHARQAAQVAGLCLALGALRAIGIERESLWIDEGWSIWFAQQSLSALWTDASNIELHPPLYYSLLKLWIALFGQSDSALRALSATLNVFTVPLVYAIGRWSCPELPGSRALGHRVGLLAATLFGLCYLQLQYAQEARTYTLLVFAVAAILASTVYILRTSALGRPPSYLSFGLFGATLAFAMWTHHVAYLSVALAGSFLTLWVVSNRTRRDQHGRHLLWATCVATLLAGRAIYVLLRYSLHNASDFWLLPPDPYRLALEWTLIFGADFGRGAFVPEVAQRVVLYGLWPCLGLWAILRRAPTELRWRVGCVCIQGLGLALLNVGLSYTLKPLFMPRTVLPAQVGWVVMCAWSLLALILPERVSGRSADRDTEARRAQLNVLGLVLVGCFAVGAHSYYARRPAGLHKRPWRDAVHGIAQRASANAQVFTLANRAPLVEHYLTQSGRSDLRVVPLPRALEVPSTSTCFETERGCPFFVWPTTAEDYDAVRTALSTRPADSAWLIFETGNPLLPEGKSVAPGQLTFEPELPAKLDRYADILVYTGRER